MIQNLSTSYLLTSELKITAQRITDVVAQSFPGETIVQQLVHLIREDVDLLEQATARTRTNEFTAELAARDEERDAAFVAFRNYAKAISGRQSPNLAQAGRLIFGLIETRGMSLHRLGYSQQSAALNELFDDLATPEAVQAIDVMQGQAWYDELRHSHTLFENTYQEKVNVESQQDLPHVHTIRKNLSNSLVTLLGVLDAVQRISVGGDRESETDQLVARVNAITSEIDSSARARRTRQANGSTTESDAELLTATSS